MAEPVLKPLNSATCPKCRKAESARMGYSKEHKGSAWKCKACGCAYLVPTLVLAKNVKKD
jgi:transcription elongation factor Elf1